MRIPRCPGRLRARIGAPADELVCGKIIVASHEGSGDAVEGRRLGESFVVRAVETGMTTWGLSIRASLLTLANGQGEFPRVVEDADRLLAEPLDRRARAQAMGYLALALVDLGRFDDAADTIEAGLAVAADDADGRFDLLWAQAELALATGDPSRAETVADACIERFGSDDYGDVLFVRITRAWARFDQGREPGVPIPSDQPVHPCWAGTLPESAGIAALATGDPAAADLFATAGEAYARYHRRGELRCRWAHGEALRQAGRSADAIRVLEAAESEAEALGMEPLIGRIRRSLRLAGSRRSAPRASSRHLSGREREVLKLVGLGLTNIQIARRMGLGRPTVSRTLSNAMAKLGADSRGQAVALAGDLD